MKRFFLVIILLFPILTLVFWVFRGDSIRPRKVPDAKVDKTGSPTNIIETNKSNFNKSTPPT